MCSFADYSCEEWAYFRDACDIEADVVKIKAAFIAKGLNLSETRFVINKHLGKYIGGSVVPIEEGVAVGGYVFAVKGDAGIKIVADGNGVIMCEMLADYPDFPSFLIPECIDASGSPVFR